MILGLAITAIQRPGFSHACREVAVTLKGETMFDEFLRLRLAHGFDPGPRTKVITDLGFKSHLGDGVYADFDGFMVVLTTEDGIRASNTIYLEPEVLRALDGYRDQLKKLPPTWSPNHNPASP